jgi:acetate kinase
LPTEPEPLPLDGPILIVNPGASSPKIMVVRPDDRVLASDTLGHTEGRIEENGIAEMPDRLNDVGAAGVRVVHGGEHFSGPMLVEESVVDVLEDLSDLAPLHNPPAVSALRALRGARIEVPIVACFDTAFHAGLPPAAVAYALPYRWRIE